MKKINGDLSLHEFKKSVLSNGTTQILITSEDHGEFEITDICKLDVFEWNLFNEYDLSEFNDVLKYRDVIKLYRYTKEINSSKIKEFISSIKYEYYHISVNEKGGIVNLDSDLYLLEDSLFMNKGNLTLYEGEIKECLTRNIYHPSTDQMKIVQLL